MALVLKDRVKVLATTTGTGTFTLGAAVTGYQDFSVIGDGNTTYYTIAAQASPDWEVGIGTYTASGTLLSRDTILESSNGGAAVDFPAGIKDVFVTYPAERATYLDTAGAYPVQNTFNTLNAANAVLTAGTVATTPVSATDIANKSYVDTIAAAGISYHSPVRVESPTPLNATYNNGTAGVGATLTNAGTQVALVIDGVTVAVNDRVLIYTQTNATQNGVYVVTNVGSGSTNWVLTRAPDADTYAPNSPNALGQGDGFYVTSGNTGAGELYVCNTPGTITFGTTNITFTQISSAQIYSAGTGLTLSGTTFSITDTGTAGTYGNASTVPVITTNAQGQVTSVTDTAIAIASGAVSGLAASATTDTTNASNITSGTLGTSRLSGSYTGITGVGTLSAGTWNGSTIGATYGGTGLSSFAAGDLIYADSSTTLARLADTAVGNALISGGASADPSWGKIGLATHVDGILPVANGGTGNATNQSASVANSATFNDGGSGAASGSTFNGSSPLTISYNTIGAYPTTNPAGYTSNTGTVTSVGGTGTVNGLTLTGTVTTSGNLTLGGTLSGIANSALTNSSVTVNGTSIALGASGTITANNPNALTINNGGAGAASGTTYNGSSAITISYNTVGAPSTTGTNASGTWGISISGNAGTVTNGVYTVGDQTIAGNKTFTGIVNGTFESSNARFKFKAADADGGNYALIGLDWGGTAGTYKDFEVYDYVNGRALFRSFGATRNFEVYGSISAASLAGGAATGTGASGTWGINISGTAASATSAPSYLPLAGGTMTGALAFNRNDLERVLSSNNTSAGGATQFYIDHSYANVNIGNLRGVVNGRGSFWQFDNSARAPVFYDSNNTGYYCDPNSTSRLGEVNADILRSYQNIYTDGDYGYGHVGLYASTRFQGVFAMGDAYKLPASGIGSGNLYGIAWSHPNAGGAAANLNTHGALILENGAFLAALSGSIRCRDDMRAPIFYDSNDTGYYVNPNDSSQFRGIYANDWFRAQGSTGLYFQDYGHGLWAPEPAGNPYGNVATYNGGRNGWAGYGFGSRYTWMHSGSTIGLHDNTRSWLYEYFPDVHIFRYGYVTNDSSMRAPIFYDSNDTGYYCDPNSTSRFVAVQFATNNWNTSTDGNNRIYFENASSTYIRGITGSWYIQLGSTSTTTTIVEGAGNFYTTGAVTAYWSDKRLKKNIEKINDWREILSKINGYRFEWNDLGLKILGDSGDQERGVKVGVIAQEAKEALPQSAVVQLMQYENKVDGVLIPKKDIDYDPENPYLTVQLEKYIPVLIEASKGLLDENEQLKATIQSLVGRIAALEQKGI